jgi:hypothetical protein
LAEGGIDLPHSLGFPWKLETEVVDMGAQVGMLADFPIGEMVFPGRFQFDELYFPQKVETIQEPPDPSSPVAFP